MAEEGINAFGGRSSAPWSPDLLLAGATLPPLVSTSHPSFSTFSSASVQTLSTETDGGYPDAEDLGRESPTALRLTGKPWRRMWNSTEDSILVKLVQEFGPTRWKEKAERIPGRTARQCRERWHNHLEHNLNKEGGCASKACEQELEDHHLQLVQRWRSMLRIDEWFENLGSSVLTNVEP